MNAISSVATACHRQYRAQVPVLPLHRVIGLEAAARQYDPAPGLAPALSTRVPADNHRDLALGVGNQT
ncbi:MAG: hypothetical protein Q7R45_17015 [Sulfuricaulis sp.]|nr:hypothetical protein [Sulfuricaulis sp.]